MTSTTHNHFPEEVTLTHEQHAACEMVALGEGWTIDAIMPESGVLIYCYGPRAYWIVYHTGKQSPVDIGETCNAPSDHTSQPHPRTPTTSQEARAAYVA